MFPPPTPLGHDLYRAPATAFLGDQVCSPFDRLDTARLVVRPARRDDAPVIAALLLEGFAADYGPQLRTAAGRRALLRISELPHRLAAVVVVAPVGAAPVAMAGLRTSEAPKHIGQAERRILIQELGMGRASWIALRRLLRQPTSYQPRDDEAYLYSVVVTAAWRRRGLGSRLLAYLHAAALQRGKRHVVLGVDATADEARSFYERQGYTLRYERRSLGARLRLGGTQELLLSRDVSW